MGVVVRSKDEYERDRMDRKINSVNRFYAHWLIIYSSFLVNYSKTSFIAMRSTWIFFLLFSASIFLSCFFFNSEGGTPSSFISHLPFYLIWICLFQLFSQLFKNVIHCNTFNVNFFVLFSASIFLSCFFCFLFFLSFYMIFLLLL